MEKPQPSSKKSKPRPTYIRRLFQRIRASDTVEPPTAEEQQETTTRSTESDTEHRDTQDPSSQDQKTADGDNLPTTSQNTDAAREVTIRELCMFQGQLKSMHEDVQALSKAVQAYKIDELRSFNVILWQHHCRNFYFEYHRLAFNLDTPDSPYRVSESDLDTWKHGYQRLLDEVEQLRQYQGRLFGNNSGSRPSVDNNEAVKIMSLWDDLNKGLFPRRISPWLRSLGRNSDGYTKSTLSVGHRLVTASIVSPASLVSSTIVKLVQAIENDLMGDGLKYLHIALFELAKGLVLSLGSEPLHRRLFREVGPLGQVEIVHLGSEPACDGSIPFLDGIFEKLTPRLALQQSIINRCMLRRVRDIFTFGEDAKSLASAIDDMHIGPRIKLTDNTFIIRAEDCLHAWRLAPEPNEYYPYVEWFPSSELRCEVIALQTVEIFLMKYNKKSDELTVPVNANADDLLWLARDFEGIQIVNALSTVGA